MISKENLVCVGRINRPHSFKGELQFSIDKEIALKRGDFIFIQTEGQMVPFQVLNCKGNEQNPIVKLEFVDSYEQAQEMAGSQVFSENYMDEKREELSFIGYEIIDKELGSIGSVNDVREMPQQMMLVVFYNNQDRYIPLVEDFINYISPEKKEIWLTLPKGILDI